MLFVSVDEGFGKGTSGFVIVMSFMCRAEINCLSANFNVIHI